jgi:integrase
MEGSACGVQPVRCPRSGGSPPDAVGHAYSSTAFCVDIDPHVPCTYEWPGKNPSAGSYVRILRCGSTTLKSAVDVDGTLKTPKNLASKRTLKLTPRALAALKAHKVRQNEERLKAGADVWEDHNLVFPNTIGKPMNAGNFYRREFQLLLKRAGLGGEDFTFHSLWHTFATTLAARGVHPSTAQKMLVHSDIRMTLAIYTHATDEMQDVATAALESAFS